MLRAALPQGEGGMWRITQAALDWYAGKYADDAEAKRRVFAAVEQARAAHLTRTEPAAVLC